MTSTWTPWKATIELAGTTLLSVHENLAAVLDSLERQTAFRPTHHGLSERDSIPYDRDALLAFATKRGGQPLPQTLAYVRRETAPKYQATCSLSHRPQLRFAFDPGTLPRERRALFDFADDLAAAFKPDWGSAHFWNLGRDEALIGSPWTNDAERDAEWMFRAAALAPKDYYPQGPRGLSMRTYVGPHFIAQLGEERIRAAPLAVARQAWAGYRIDLVAEPWDAEFSVLLDAWRQGMAHLRVSGVFAEPVCRNGRVISWKRGPNCTVGGTVDAGSSP